MIFMKKKLKYNFTIFLTCISVIAFSQSRIDFCLIAIPSFSTINTEGHSVGYKYIIPINYGLSVFYNKNKIIITTGISHITQGTKLKVESTTVNNPEAGIGNFDVFIRAKTIAIPVVINYLIISKNKTEFFGGLGIYAGYIYSQQEENTSIPQNYQPPGNIIYAGGSPKRFLNINIFDEIYYGVNVGVGLRQFLSKRISLQVRPNFLFQLRKELLHDTDKWTNRLMTYSFDIGISFSIGKTSKKK